VREVGRGSGKGTTSGCCFGNEERAAGLLHDERCAALIG
jgi:hypothetical protein